MSVRELPQAGFDTDLTPAEFDPHGLPTNAPGAKLDGAKPRLDLLLDFGRALNAVGQVATYGAGKYTPNGWLTVPDGEARYTAALLRHLLQEGAGAKRDPETHLLHAAHTAWNALARLELVLRRPEDGGNQ